MTNLALTNPMDQSQLKRLAHGVGALGASLGLLLVVFVLADTIMGPKLDLMASLKSRAQSIDALETALKVQQAELSNNLQLIGAKSDEATASLSSAQIVETLGSDGEALTGELEARGFTLNNRTEPAERPITPTLAVYAISVNFAGDDKAAAALMSAPVASDAQIVKLSLNGEGAAGGNAVTLSLDIQRIGASAEPNDGAPNE